jgi:hypothetical protein
MRIFGRPLKLYHGIVFLFLSMCGLAVASSVYHGSVVLDTSSDTLSSQTSAPVSIISKSGGATAYNFLFEAPVGCASAGFAQLSISATPAATWNCDGGITATGGIATFEKYTAPLWSPNDPLCTNGSSYATTNGCAAAAITSITGSAPVTVSTGASPVVACPSCVTHTDGGPLAVLAPLGIDVLDATINCDICVDTTTSLQTINTNKQFTQGDYLWMNYPGGLGVKADPNTISVGAGLSSWSVVASPSAAPTATSATVMFIAKSYQALNGYIPGSGPAIWGLLHEDGLTPPTPASLPPVAFIDNVGNEYLAGAVSTSRGVYQNAGNCNGGTPQGGSGYFVCRIQISGGTAVFNYATFNSTPVCVASAESHNQDITSVVPSQSSCTVSSSSGDSDWVNFIVIGNGY